MSNLQQTTLVTTMISTVTTQSHTVNIEQIVECSSNSATSSKSKSKNKAYVYLYLPYFLADGIIAKLLIHSISNKLKSEVGGGGGITSL